MNAKLFTFVITSYKNHKYIYEAVDSVLEQDYPRIQLIFSDDGSGDFDTKALQSYLDKHAGKNITDVQIYAHDANRGTVQNMEFCRQKAEGEYIMYMAADDALNGSDVLSRYAEEFERLGDDALVLCSKVAMCGEELDDIRSYEPSEEGIRYIRESSPRELFGRLSHTWTIPTTSCCYRREVYDVVGAYDTDYFIMEDGPLFMKLARGGHRIHWVDDMVAARHRGGGISHGNTLNLSESYRKYRYDEIIFYEKEVLPYKDELSPSDRKPMEAKWDYLQWAYFDTFVLPNMSAAERLRYNLKHLPQFFKRILRRTKNKSYDWMGDSGLHHDLTVLSLGCLLAYLLFVFIPVPIPDGIRAFFLRLSVWVGLFGFAGLVFVRLLRILCVIYKSLRYIFTGRG